MPQFAVRSLAVLFLERQHVIYSSDLRSLFKISRLIMDEKGTEEDHRPCIDTSSNQGSSGIVRAKDILINLFWLDLQRLTTY